MTSYPTPKFRRTALAPGLLAAVVLLAGLALITNESVFIWIRFPTSILALIICVFAWQAKQWWWFFGLVPIAILWNPVWVIPIKGDPWLICQYVGAIVFIAAGILIKVKNPEDRNRRR